MQFEVSKYTGTFGTLAVALIGSNLFMFLLFQIPLETEIRKCSDEGVPVVLSNPDSAVSKAYSDVAQKVVSRLEELSEQPFLRPELNL